MLHLAKNYNGKILRYPGDKPLKTKEGVSALNECVRDLKRANPVPILYPSAGLSKAANDHVKDQSQSGRTGHIGGDRSSVKSRIDKIWQVGCSYWRKYCIRWKIRATGYHLLVN